MRWATVLSKPWALAAGLTILLIAVNILVQPHSPRRSISAAISTCSRRWRWPPAASTPSILAGGIDVSIGPLLGLVNILVVSPVLPPALQGPLITPVVCLAARRRWNHQRPDRGRGADEPVVRTIGTYLILAGLDVKLLPTPAGRRPLGGALRPDRPIPGSSCCSWPRPSSCGPLCAQSRPQGASRGRRRRAGRLLDRKLKHSGREVIADGLGGLFASVAGVRAGRLSAADADARSSVHGSRYRRRWRLAARAWRVAKGA